MVQDPYQVSPDDLQLATVDDSGDEFDGLDLAHDGEMVPKKKRSAVLPVVLLVILAGGAFATWKIFLGGETDMDRMIAIAEGERPAVADTAAGNPEQLAVADATTPVAPEVAPVDAAAPAPVVDGTTTEAMPPVADPAATAPADMPPGVTAPADAAAVTPPVDVPATIVPQVVTPATPEAAPVVADTDATPPPEAVSAEAAPAIDAAPAPVVDNAVAGATPPALAEAAAVAHEHPLQPLPPLPPKPENTVSGESVAAVPAPPTNQLQPIDPKNVGKLPDTSMPVTPTEKKAAEATKAVNEILGQPALVTPDVQAAQQNAIAKQVEVTPRAAQVIVVKKAYSASSPQAMNAAGDRVLAAGQYGDAVTLYDRQLRNNPSDPLALSGKALALQKAGRNDEALKVYDRLIDLNPRDVEAMTNYLGLLQKQNPSQALTRLQGMTQQYPDNAAVAGQLAMVQAKMMDTPNALRNFQKAAALDPSNPTYAYNSAVLFDRVGNGEKARAYYMQALQLARSNEGSVPVEVIRNRLRALGN